jgi:hypothetical protein
MVYEYDKTINDRFERSIKMRSKLLFLIVLILTMAALPGMVQANFYTDPGFEEGSGNLPDAWGEWAGYGAGSYEYHIDDGTARTGEDCMEVISPSGGSNDFQWLFMDVPDMSENTTYTIGGYFKDNLPGGSTALPEITFEFWNETRDNGGTKVGEPSEQFPIPNDGGWHFVSWTLVSPAGTLMIAPMIGIDGEGEGAYLLDDVIFVEGVIAGASGVHSPDPEDGESVPPGLDILRWTRYKGQQGDDLLCTFQWAVDANDSTFEANKQDLFTDQDVNSCTLSTYGKVVTAEHNYLWRVNCEDPNGGNEGAETLIGPIWHFTTVNTAPVVEAGLKQAKWLPSTPGSVTFQLAPTVSDDGLPVPPGALTYLWTKTAGTGVVTFTPSAVVKAPTASMSVADDYELTLTVSDGSLLTGSDTVKLRVHANGTTGLIGLYDMEEGDTAPLVHDDYADRHHGDRMANGVKEPIDPCEPTVFIGTNFDTTGGHNDTDPCNLTPDTPNGELGGLVFHGAIPGYIQLKDSVADPNWQDPTWADLQDEVTLAAWIKVDPAEGGWDDGWETIISKGYDASTDDGAYILCRNGSTDGVSMYAYGVTPRSVNSIQGVNDGEWHHVVGTYDGAHICVYVDGFQDACVETDGAQMNRVEAPLTFGDTLGPDDLTTYSSYAPFGGIMDEVRIHDIGLPHASDDPGYPEAAPLHAIKARSVRAIYRTSGGHVSCGGNYLEGDANEDCYVDLGDVKTMAQMWLECNSISEERCDANTDKP